MKFRSTVTVIKACSPVLLAAALLILSTASLVCTVAAFRAGMEDTPAAAVRPAPTRPVQPVASDLPPNPCVAGTGRARRHLPGRCHRSGWPSV